MCIEESYVRTDQEEHRRCAPNTILKVEHGCRLGVTLGESLLRTLVISVTGGI